MSADTFHVRRAQEIARAKEDGRREGFEMAMANEVPRAQAAAQEGGLLVLLTGVAIGVACSGFFYWLLF